MAFSFVFPLFTGLLTGYIFKKCKDEIAYFAGLVAIISLMVSLFLAPWEIQLLLLLGVLVVTQKLLQENEYKLKLQDKSQRKLSDSNQHKLIASKTQHIPQEHTYKYRGTTYHITGDTTKAVDSEVDIYQVLELNKVKK
jgi:membrane protein implicated in regulation of membrane protease activity